MSGLKDRNKFHLNIKSVDKDISEKYIYQLFKYLNYKVLEVGDIFEIVDKNDHLFTIKRINKWRLDAETSAK